MTAAAPAIELRAFRGTRRSSVYRAHVVAVAAFRRIVGAAADEHLSLLGSLNQNLSVELDKDDARRLADEAKRLRLRATLLELDDDLTAIAEVASWCARASGRSRLLIQRLQAEG